MRGYNSWRVRRRRRGSDRRGCDRGLIVKMHYVPACWLCRRLARRGIRSGARTRLIDNREYPRSRRDRRTARRVWVRWNQGCLRRLPRPIRQGSRSEFDTIRYRGGGIAVRNGVEWVIDAPKPSPEVLAPLHRIALGFVQHFQLFVPGQRCYAGGMRFAIKSLLTLPLDSRFVCLDPIRIEIQNERIVRRDCVRAGGRKRDRFDLAASAFAIPLA